MGRKNITKKNMSVFTAIVMATIIFSSACASTQTASENIAETENIQTQEETTESNQDVNSQVVDLTEYTVEYSDRDTNTDWQSEEQTLIKGENGQVIVEGDGVTVESGTITITEAGTYVLSGTLANQHILVNAPDQKIRIVLNGVSLSCATEAPIIVQESKKVVMTVADGTENEINDNRDTDVDATTSSDEEADEISESNSTEDDDSSEISKDDEEELIATAAIFSKEDITFQGNGKLCVNSSNNNGITSKDGLLFMDGTYEITAEGTGITGKDYVIIDEGTYTITSGKDAIKSTNDTEEYKGFVKIESGDITINAGQDGISAVTLAYVAEGSLNMTTGGGSENGVSHTDGSGMMPSGGPQEGATDGEIPEAPDMSVDGEMPEAPNMSANGEMPQKQDMESTVTDADDDTIASMKGIKAGTLIYIAGGNINCNSADDSLHSDGDVIITEGTIQVASGDDGIHADDTLEIYDGTITITESYEGLEGLNITIYDGTIDITASDDGINVNGGSDQFGFGAPGQNMPNQSEQTAVEDTTNEIEETSDEDSMLTIAGGTIHVNADGDGLDSNGSILQTGGDVIVDGPTNGGNGALDYDEAYTMTGGTLLAIGASSMLQTISDDSTIYCVTAYYTDTQEAETAITVMLGDSEETTYQSQKTFDAITYASAAITENTEVTIKAGTEEKTATVTTINTQMQADGTISTGAVTDSMGGGRGGGRPGAMNGERPNRNGFGQKQDAASTETTKEEKTDSTN